MRTLAVTALLLALGCSSSYTPRAGRRISIVMSGGQIAYVRDGRTIEHGILGGGLVDAVEGVPEAEEAAHIYHRRTVSGFLVGMGGLLCSSFALTRALRDAEGDGDGSTALTVSLGCFAGSMAGFVIMGSGAPYLYDAINIYNDAAETPTSPGPPGSAPAR
jgi:hypothetical protein